MNYKLAEQLKDAGFPQTTKRAFVLEKGGKSDYIMSVEYPDGYKNLLSCGYEVTACPDLSELIEACGKEFRYLSKVILDEEEMWKADAQIQGVGSYTDLWAYDKTPEVVVAKLYLKLNKK